MIRGDGGALLRIGATGATKEWHPGTARRGAKCREGRHRGDPSRMGRREGRGLITIEGIGDRGKQ